MKNHFPLRALLYAKVISEYNKFAARAAYTSRRTYGRHMCLPIKLEFIELLS